MNRPFSSLFMIATLLPAIAASAVGAVGTEGGHAVKQLRPCPSSPNCVSSQTADPDRRMAPIRFTGTPEAAQALLRTIIRAMPRAEITVDEPGYLAASFRSRVFGFLDEAEFIVDGAGGLVQFRSGARTGYYDFGVNRSRMKRITAAFTKAE